MKNFIRAPTEKLESKNPTSATRWTDNFLRAVCAAHRGIRHSYYLSFHSFKKLLFRYSSKQLALLLFSYTLDQKKKAATRALLCGAVQGFHAVNQLSTAKDLRYKCPHDVGAPTFNDES